MWEWIINIIIIIIFFVILFIIIKICFWLYDKIYYFNHPEKKRLNKKLLESYLVSKYGKQGKSVYKDLRHNIWEKYRIR
jgi:hypothetical protein